MKKFLSFGFLLVVAFVAYRLYRSREYLYWQGSIIETTLGFKHGFWTFMRDRFDDKKAKKEKNRQHERPFLLSPKR